MKEMIMKKSLLRELKNTLERLKEDGGFNLRKEMKKKQDKNWKIVNVIKKKEEDLQFPIT